MAVPHIPAAIGEALFRDMSKTDGGEFQKVDVRRTTMFSYQADWRVGPAGESIPSGWTDVAPCNVVDQLASIGVLCFWQVDGIFPAAINGLLAAFSPQIKGSLSLEGCPDEIGLVRHHKSVFLLEPKALEVFSENQFLSE